MTNTVKQARRQDGYYYHDKRNKTAYLSRLKALLLSVDNEIEGVVMRMLLK